MVQMVQKSPKCKNGPKLSDMVQNGPNFPYAFPILKFQKDTFFWDTLYGRQSVGETGDWWHCGSQTIHATHHQDEEQNRDDHSDVFDDNEVDDD